MARHVRVNDTSYKVTVDPAGTITLDTGDQLGSVVITGDLLVKGNTVAVQSESLVIKDNIIVINDQQSGSGIALGQAGIEIDRGDPSLAPAAQLFFNESLVWYDTQTGTNQSGAFVFKKADTLLVGIRTNSITTGDKDLNLNLLGPSEQGGTATISVAGVYNYEDRITDDDDIPNVKWVNNAIDSYFDKTPSPVIREGDSVLRIVDTEISGTQTRLELTLDGVVNTRFYSSEIIFFQNTKLSVEPDRTILETTSLSSDLVLRASGAGSVTVEDDLKLLSVATAPEHEAGGTKIYTQPQSFGGSGIYFINNQQNRDELISKRKAIAYSMIF